MTNSVQYLSDRLFLRVQFMNANEELTFLYLSNNEGLGPDEINQLSLVLLNQLKLYVNSVSNTFDDIYSIRVPIKNKEHYDLIILIKTEDLKGVDIVDKLNYRITSPHEYPINDMMQVDPERPVKLKITKEFQGKKPDVIGYVMSQARHFEPAYAN